MILLPADYQKILPHPHYIDSLKIYIREAIKDGAFPGCAISFGFRNRIVFQEAFGHFSYDLQSKTVQNSSIFDLASVTKVVATTTIVMILFDQGRLNLDWKVVDVVPDFKGKNKELVTIRHLLTHSSGLPGWIQFYLTMKGKEPIFKEICQTDLIYQPGAKTIYSDLGMILMQKVIETITQKPLNLLVKELITGPLNMTRTFFNPEQQYLSEIVPTEVSDFHKQLVRGVVHDENAFVMGGVSGHAGLFSSVEDLSVFCQMYLNGGIYNFERVLEPETIKLFTSRQNQVEGSTRALGWDTRSEQESMSGDFMSLQAFGHSGFTGTTVWIDPVYDLFVVLLTNRVHPTRENQKIRKVRPMVHNFVMKSILD
jgi:CubicO group peptidase (beta-lactamase class C family)